MAKRFSKLPLVENLSDTGKEAFHTTLHPPSREINPGYPDSDNTASIRTNNNINYNIEAPSGLKDGSSKWSCASYLNPNVLYTPGLVVAWIEGHKDTLTAPIKRYLSAAGDDFVGNVSTSFGSETYIYLGQDGTTYYFSHKDPGNAVAYIKPVRDSHCPKSESFSEWRTIGASNDIQMEVADLYRQGIIYAGQMPAPTPNSISINSSNTVEAPVPDVVDQITYTYTNPGELPEARDMLVPITTKTISRNALTGDDDWYSEEIQDIEEQESFDFTQLPKGSFFIDAQDHPIVAEVTDTNELQVKTRCFDVKGGVTFTGPNYDTAFNNIPYTIYPRSDSHDNNPDTGLMKNISVPQGPYEIEFQNNIINLVSRKFLCSGDFPSNTSSSVSKWRSEDQQASQTNGLNHEALRIGIKPPIGAPIVNIKFSVPGVTVSKTTAESWDAYMFKPVINDFNGEKYDTLEKYGIDGAKNDFPSNFTYTDNITIPYMVVPSNYLPGAEFNTGIVNTFDLIQVEEGYNYFTTSENLNSTLKVPSTPSNKLFEFRPPVEIKSLSAQAFYDMTYSGRSAKQYSDATGYPFGDFSATYTYMSNAYKFEYAPKPGISLNVNAWSGYSLQEWLGMMRLEWKPSATVPALPSGNQYTHLYIFALNLQDYPKTDPDTADYMTRGRLVLTTEAKTTAQYVAAQLRNRVLNFPGAVLTDPVGVYYKTYGAVPLTERIVNGTVVLLDNDQALTGFWAKLKKILVGTAKVLSIATQVVQYVTAIVSIFAVERTVGNGSLKEKFEEGTTDGDYVSTTVVQSTNTNLPLDRDSIQTMSQLDSSLAKEGSFQVARLYNRSNPYAPGGAVAFSTMHKQSVDGFKKRNAVKNYTADLFTVWTDSGKYCNSDFRDILVVPDERDFEATAKTSYITRADRAVNTSNNGFYDNALSQTCWGCPIVLYTGLLKQAALRCRISRDLEVIPVINQSLAPLATNPAQPDFEAVDVMLKYLNILPVLMPYKCVKPVEFLKCLTSVSNKVSKGTHMQLTMTDKKQDAANDAKFTKINNRVNEVDARLKKIVASVQNVNNRMNTMNVNKANNMKNAKQNVSMDDWSSPLPPRGPRVQRRWGNNNNNSNPNNSGPVTQLNNTHNSANGGC